MGLKCHALIRTLIQGGFHTGYLFSVQTGHPEQVLSVGTYRGDLQRRSLHALPCTATRWRCGQPPGTSSPLCVTCASDLAARVYVGPPSCGIHRMMRIMYHGNRNAPRQNLEFFGRFFDSGRAERRGGAPPGGDRSGGNAKFFCFPLHRGGRASRDRQGAGKAGRTWNALAPLPRGRGSLAPDGLYPLSGPGEGVTASRRPAGRAGIAPSRAGPSSPYRPGERR